MTDHTIIQKIPEGKGAYKTFVCTNRQAQAIAQLREAHKGFAAVKAYRPTTNWIERPSQNIQMIVGFLTHRLYQRQMDAMSDLSVSDLNLSKWVPSKGKDACATAEEQFALCVELAKTSKSKSIEGELKNAHTAAHERNYLTICNSIKVHYISEKNADGIKVPVLNADGLPMVESILVPYLEIKTVTVVEGKRKVVNSGSKVLMDNAIEKAMSKRYAFRMMSLKDDSFDEFKVGSETISPENLDGAKHLLKMVS